MVSVVIPNYNGIKYLRECIESLYEHTKIEIELIIIDNASTDDSYEWVKESYPEVVFEGLDRNYGFSRAVNEGIKRAKGEYVLLLNNDTVIKPNFVEALVACIKKDPNIFAVSSKMLAYSNEKIIDDAGDEYTLLGWTRKRGDGKSSSLYTKNEEVFSTCAGAALYRRYVFDEIGYFDENFFAYMEDVDISYRARLHGYKNFYCAEAEVLHIGSATSGSRHNAFKVKLSARNNVYVPYKNMPLIQLIVNMPWLVLGVLIKMVVFTKKGFGKAYVEGLIEGLTTTHKVSRVKFQADHWMRYVRIELQLIMNTLRYVEMLVKK